MINVIQFKFNYVSVIIVENSNIPFVSNLSKTESEQNKKKNKNYEKSRIHWNS